MKNIVFDSSSIISISDNCLIEILGRLSEKAIGEFYISKSVEFETVIHPMKIKRFELSAIRIKKAIEEGWIKVYEKDVSEKALKIEEITNSIFFKKGNALEMFHKGECESLALCKEVGADTLVIDERSTRMLLENPILLKENLSENYEAKIDFSRQNYERLKGILGEINIVRSVELIALAFEFGLAEKQLSGEHKALEAALYSLKYAGCAVSSMEIESFLKEH